MTDEHPARRGTAAIVSGLVTMLLLAPLLAGLALWLGVDHARSVEDDLGPGGRPVRVAAGTEVDVRGEAYEPGAAARCTVTRDAGTAVPFTAEADTGASGIVRLGGFTAPSDGEYTVTCPGAGQVALLDAGARRGAAWGVGLGLAGALVGGGLTFLVGAVVALIGAARWRRSR